MFILVCGGRKFKNSKAVYDVLDQYYLEVTKIIEGGAQGADRLAREWAIKNRIPYQTFNADWDKHGDAAGPIRNKQMLEQGKPDLVIAFPGHVGTANMVKQAREAGVKVLEV